MLRSISHADWQVLKAVLRSSPDPAPGWTLRLAPIRYNRDGTFLADLVKRELVRTVPGAPHPPPADADVTAAVRVPGPFHERYELTPRGRYAAEYGEYDDAKKYEWKDGPL